jgi:cell division protein FtsL
VTEKLKVRRNFVSCPSRETCLNWASYQRNVSLLLSDIVVEIYYARGFCIGDNSQFSLCTLEDMVLSTNLWLVLIISIVIVAISTTYFRRYKCTSEWGKYKTLTNSLTKVCGVMLRVAVSTKPRARSLRLLFLASVFLCGQSTVVQAFPQGILLTARTKRQFQTWINSSPQVLNLIIHYDIISFSRMVTKQKCQECKNIF